MKTTSAIVAAFFLSAVLGGCASEYTVIDRSSLVISENARVSVIAFGEGTKSLPLGERDAAVRRLSALSPDDQPGAPARQRSKPDDSRGRCQSRNVCCIRR